MLVHCRISQGPSGPPALVCEEGFTGPPIHVATGIYRVALDSMLGFTAKVGLQASVNQPNVTVSVECIDATTVEVQRCAGGGEHQDGDVWILAVEAVPLMRRAQLAIIRFFRAIARL